MEKVASLGIILFFFANSIFAQVSTCSRKTFFGDAEICLPTLDGYQECYLEPIVKELADGTEVPMNTVLGFYLDNQTFKKKDSLGLFDFDNYFKVYSTKSLQGHKANSESLRQIQEALTSNFIVKNWDLLKEEIDKAGLNIDIGIPVIIKSYSYNKNSFTHIMLAKYSAEGMEPYTMIMTINGLLVKERLIWMAYYLNYEGKDSIEQIQQNSNEILDRLLKANK